MGRKGTIWLFIVLVFGVPAIVYGGYLWYEAKFLALPVYGKQITVKGEKLDHRIPDYALIDHEGKPSRLNEWENKIVVADFFFTHCPSICPKMTNNLKKVQKSFGTDEILLRSFSVDPERDDVARLGKYIHQFNINTTNWKLLTGDKKEIYKLARNGFMIVATDGDGGPNDFIHSEKLILVDKRQRIRGYYDGTSPKEVEDLINDIKKLKNEN